MSPDISYFSFYRYVHDEELNLLPDEGGRFEWDEWMDAYNVQSWWPKMKSRRVFSSVRIFR